VSAQEDRKQEDFEQIRLQCLDAIQYDYEVIRPIVLFAETAAERSRQTGMERTVVGDKARRFVMESMLGLVDQRPGRAGRKGHRYPDAVAAYILYVKQMYPPIGTGSVKCPDTHSRAIFLDVTAGESHAPPQQDIFIARGRP